MATGSLAWTMQGWVDDALATAGYPVPARKRVAHLLTGLVAGEPATVSGLSQTLHGLAVTHAQEPSIARRLLRTLADPRLDPTQLLPAVFRHHLPELLAGLVASHAANQGCPPAQHARFRPVQMIVDETSHTDRVHLLVIGLWYQHLVLPLAVRAWPQNQPLAEDAYWVALGSLCQEVHGLLPPCLRDHVLLLADRGYSTARLVDLASSLGWAWAIRLTGLVRVQFPNGTERPLRSLVRAAGQTWPGLATAVEALDPADPANPANPADPANPAAVAIFKKAGWRSCQVVGVWLTGQAEPWLLATSLPAAVARLAEYAQRWAIERLFLCWKSHGWDLEAGRVCDAPRLARLVSGLVLATWWRVALGVAARAAFPGPTPDGRPRPPRQLRLPFAEWPGDPRAWPAKFSLFTWGRKAVLRSDCRHATPPLDWRFPDWTVAPTGSAAP